MMSAPELATDDEIPVELRYRHLSTHNSAS